MSKGSRILMVMLLVFWVTSAKAAEFSPALEYELEKAQGKDFVSAIVILESPIDIRALDFALHTRKASLAERHQEVLAALKYNADQTQPAFRGELDAAKARGELNGYTAYWIENLFVIHASKDFIESLRNRGDVKYVTENFRAELIEPIITEGRDPERNPLDTETTTPGQDAIRATEVNRVLGITGQGVLVANCDTGVEGTHPALASRWRGNTEPVSECWRDALGGYPTPADANGHGTHVMGTITGRAISGNDTNTVGSAPNARWIATNSINQGVGAPFDNDIIADYQWFADPDGNPGSLDDVPDVIQNSWGVFTGLGYAQCFDLWNTVILNCEAAGPVITWSAGNESTSGLRSPAIYSINAYQIFSVGAVDATNFPAPYPLASFSSQGPTPCVPAVPDNIKPEISAPGVNVYSSVPGGGYSSGYSGTSMAGPHVAGVVALMREACPNCDHITIKDAIMQTAIDYGPAGQDNQYGHGFIDAYDAVVAVSALGRVCGVVRDASNNPIAGATVSITGQPNSTTTEADGSYCLALQEGTYTAVASAFGYISQTSTSFTIVEGDTVTRNFNLSLAPQGTVSGTVTDCNGGPAVGATVEVLGTPVPDATTNGAGFYSITLPQGTYDMRASGAGCAPHQVNGVVIGAATTRNFTLLSDPIYSCSQPDAYGYYMCENGDGGGPAYSWFEIAPSAGGPGTDTGQSCDDCPSGPYNFPFAFQFYGTTYTQYYLSSNGMMTFGTSSIAFTNICFPNSQPAGIYAFWDDLYTACSTAELATYYDAANNRLIVEYYNVCHCCGEGNNEKFQIIVYDQSFYPSETGDNHIAVQYNSMSLLGSSTVGIKTAAGAFSQYVCNGSYDANAQGLANGRVILFTTGQGCDLGPADIAVTPASLSGNAPLGGTDTGSIQICNTGVCPLTWNIVWDQITPAVALSSATMPVTIEMSKEEILLIEAINRGEKPVADVEDRSSGSPLDAQGGPDAFGYTWIDSDEPGGPTYNWVEINAIGTNVGLTGDDQVVNVTLPFIFNFYGTDYSSVNVSSNGNIHFGPASAQYSNFAIPSVSAPLGMIAAFWDDLYLPGGGTVYRYHDAANNRFIIEWDGIAHYPGTGDFYTFQIMLYANGRIVVQYEDFVTGSVGLTTCTVGLNSPTGTDGLQVVNNAAYLHTNLAIQYQAAVDWLAITPPLSGTVEPGQCVTVDVTFDAGDLPAGTYTGNLQVSSNDPDEAQVNVPVNFTVGSFDPPTSLTIYYLPTTNQLQFIWTGTGAPFYELWSATDSQGPYNTLEGTTPGTSLLITYDGSVRKFFYVVATDGTVLGRASLPEIGRKE
ncbi:S8 family serine peptidase [bacterium]|nr:S8 family serine peptidase [bacterium]